MLLGTQVSIHMLLDFKIIFFESKNPIWYLFKKKNENKNEIIFSLYTTAKKGKYAGGCDFLLIS